MNAWVVTQETRLAEWPGPRFRVTTGLESLKAQGPQCSHLLTRELGLVRPSGQALTGTPQLLEPWLPFQELSSSMRYQKNRGFYPMPGVQGV